ncbi:hypothetical protein SNEBB_005678 [Seison nebaliae]|nr:hypothetical protein SNEBB_005678 [Seison nebaliae]
MKGKNFYRRKDSVNVEEIKSKDVDEVDVEKVIRTKIEIDQSLIDEVSGDSLSDARKKLLDTTSIYEVIAYSHHPSAKVRKLALVQMCPCRVHDKIELFWERVIEMVDDGSPMVRDQVLHTLCDGSPKSMDIIIGECLEKFNRDDDPSIRRKSHKAFVAWQRYGKWNIM